MPPAKGRITNRISAKPTSKPRGKKSKLHHLEEYDEDPGRAGSERYQVLANAIKAHASKSKAFLQRFQEDVDAKGMRLKVFCQEKEKEFIEDQRELGVVLSQLSQQLSSREHGRLGTLRKKEHSLFQQAQAQREDVSSVLKQLKTDEAELRSDKLELPVAAWEQDMKDIKEVLEYGNRYGVALLGRALAPELMSSTELEQLGSCEKEQLVKDLFKDGHEVLTQETWGHVAEAQLRQLSDIVKTLPVEKERPQ